MNTTLDPRIREAMARERDRGSIGVGLQAAFWATLRILAGAWNAVFAIVMFDLMRAYEINGIFDDVDSRLDSLVVPASIGFSISIIVAIVARMGSASAGRRFGGNGGLLMALTPWGLVGAVAATYVMAPRLTPPNKVGVNQDPAFNNPEVWGWWQWALYYVGEYAVYIAAGLLVLGCLVALARGAKSNKIDGMVERGEQVLGHVIQLRHHGVEVNNAPLVTISVEFTDHHGQQRFVTKRRAIPTAVLPQLHQKVMVIYDPADPGNEKKVLLALGDTSLLHTSSAQHHYAAHTAQHHHSGQHHHASH